MQRKLIALVTRVTTKFLQIFIKTSKREMVFVGHAKPWNERVQPDTEQNKWLRKYHILLYWKISRCTSVIH